MKYPRKQGQRAYRDFKKMQRLADDLQDEHASWFNTLI